MQIITWNVNGLRAAFAKGARDWLLTQNADVICLQEIKARPEQLTDEQRQLPGYQICWNPAERPGYSGVATFLRQQPLELELGIDAPLFDVEGRVIRSRHPDFLL
jgi:exodeoxyribonuclease-3